MIFKLAHSKCVRDPEIEGVLLPGFGKSHRGRKFYVLQEVNDILMILLEIIISRNMIYILAKMFFVFFLWV